MSFILDALKKSETDRQQQGSAEFAGVPTSNRREGPPRWLWVLGALLAINLVVLLGLMFRPDTSAPAATRVTPTAQPTATGAENFAEQVAAARQNAPAEVPPQATVADTPPAQTPTQVPATRPTQRSVAAVSLPTIHEVRANGTVSLPELHVDIHVYSEIPEDRFVFINMNKHKEGSQLSEGPLVKEITPHGVVLDQGGTSFLLPRD